jgi:hypothetical protein
MQRTFTYSVPLQSPQGDGFGNIGPNNGNAGSPFTVPPVPSHGHRLRDRSSGASYSGRSSLGSGTWPRGHNVLPTPDPTVASCISDEDVALQLMRLGDASNFSHGRTSASTLDDSLSGRADVASSVSDHSGDESEDAEQPALPPHPRIKSEPAAEQPERPAKKQKRMLADGLPSTDSTEPSGDEVDGDYEEPQFKSEVDEQDAAASKPKLPRGRKARGGSQGAKLPKVKKPSQAPKRAKQPSVSNGIQPPMSPASLPTQSRKASFASTTATHQLGPDEDDLSTKPRCQRCRKSKKGCDRQRPCGRCKDAGIGIEGCISEDEGNGRKGRYGRHMGIAVKKTAEKATESATLDRESERAGAILSGMATGQNNTEKIKKRKRS